MPQICRTLLELRQLAFKPLQGLVGREHELRATRLQHHVVIQLANQGIRHGGRPGARISRSLPRAVIQPSLMLLLILISWLNPSPAWSAGGLEQRLEQWPAWSLPAPLSRPGHRDLVYPSWFEGDWIATSHDLSGQELDLQYPVRFELSRGAQVVGDRAFNARSVGQALLGDQLLEVRNDPRNPNRQLADLSQDQQLESTVTGRRTEQPSADSFLADELSLQVLHGPGDPRVSQVETLSRYRRIDPDRIEAQQWQVSYGSPADGLISQGLRQWHGSLVLERAS
ncbi:MAG: hypothetical protein RLZZ32_2026 [Cyanobacteriota bacterium]